MTRKNKMMKIDHNSMQKFDQLNNKSELPPLNIANLNHSITKHVNSKKRRASPGGINGGNFGAKRLKQNDINEPVQQNKNTVAMLNELRRNLIYTLESQEGPVHAPVFTMSVIVDGQKFTGHGRSKKLARIEAAAAALRSFIQFKDSTAITATIKPMKNVDFTSDEYVENNIFNNNNTKIKSEQSSAISTILSPTSTDLDIVETIQRSLETFKNGNAEKCSWLSRLEKISKNMASDRHKHLPDKGPVMLLYELFNDIRFECTSTATSQHSKFTTIVTVNNDKFEGNGPSKKLSKNAAAKAALASLCNISFSPLQQSKLTSAGGAALVKSSLMSDTIFSMENNIELSQTFADKIGRLVIDKFTEIMVGNENYARRKVLAGFVMTQGTDIKTGKVISIATGTKCVSGEYLSVSGTVINDSHAEIIARRCLIEFFYSQLLLHCNSETSHQSIFLKPSTFNGQMNNNNNNTNNNNSNNTNSSCNYNSLYKLRDNIQFHLYINTAPCGDARVFSPHEEDTDVDKHPNRKARGQLRTKVESGEGTIPVKNSEGIQTWDGVLQGQRLLTMSCSDKIARWNVLGLQGSLLASIVQPIYLNSIVLGSLLHPAHMFRAVCGRIENSIQGLPPPYRLNKPKLALITSTETRNQIKPPNYSINWTVCSDGVEILNSFTGKPFTSGKLSRITKQSFLQRYANLIKILPFSNTRQIKQDYGETKLSVIDYQIAKKELFNAFTKEDLGRWLKKPIEQDQFTLSQLQ